jgi:hypothetical protein
VVFLATQHIFKFQIFNQLNHTGIFGIYFLLGSCFFFVKLKKYYNIVNSFFNRDKSICPYFFLLYAFKKDFCSFGVVPKTIGMALRFFSSNSLLFVFNVKGIRAGP